MYIVRRDPVARARRPRRCNRKETVGDAAGHIMPGEYENDRNRETREKPVEVERYSPYRFRAMTWGFFFFFTTPR